MLRRRTYKLIQLHIAETPDSLGRLPGGEVISITLKNKQDTAGGEGVYVCTYVCVRRVVAEGP